MSRTNPLPRLPGVDHTLTFLREGYAFIGKGCDRFGQDMFRARLMLRSVVCARGTEAARLLYDPELFTRRKAMPATVLRLLQDKGSVQLMDDADHRHRKALFTSLLMTDEAERSLVSIFENEWRRALMEWQAQDRISLLDEANLVLTRTACRWIGLDLVEGQDRRMAKALHLMIEAAGQFGPRVLGALWRRRTMEVYLTRVIGECRLRAIPADSPLMVVALFRDRDGELLTPEQAAVELLNILRPIVAIGRYIMFTAVALNDQPLWYAHIRGAPEPAQVAFVEEVRRFYPYFPAVGGIVRRRFECGGHVFAPGSWMLLDLHASCRHHATFPRPDQFDPRRSCSWQTQGFDLIPQGAGQVMRTHRCPGERLTVAVMRRALAFLTEEMSFTVPEQDLRMPPSRIPARPKEGLVLRQIRVVSG